MRLLSRSVALVTLFTVLVALPWAATAQESLLWKVTNIVTPTVIPPYTGEASPFPVVAVAPIVSETTGMEDELARLRDAAMQEAQSLIKSGSAFEPYVNGIRVGGTVDGLLGRKALIGNKWMGKGAALQVALMRSAAAQDAVKMLESYDATAGAEFSSQLNAELAANPTITMTLSEITAENLVFTSRYGRKVINFKIGSN